MKYKHLALDDEATYADPNGMRYEVTHKTDGGGICPFGWGDTISEAKTAAKKMVDVYGFFYPKIHDRHTDYLLRIYAAGENFCRPNARGLIADELIRLGLAVVTWFYPPKLSWAKFEMHEARPFAQIFLTAKGEERVKKVLQKSASKRPTTL